MINPAYCLAMDLEIGPSLYGAIHGRVRPESVLVKPAGQSWLVDFAHAGPLLFDFVLLETVIKRDLLDLGLLLRYELEERLLAGTDWASAGNEEVSPALEKPRHAIYAVRRLAAALAGPQPAPYLLGLLLCSLEPVVRFAPEV